MTTVFSFTDSMKPDSSAVDDAWYHEDNRTLAVNLHGVVYEYSGVGPFTWEQFKDAASTGQFYRYNIQRNYSPAKRLGSKLHINFQREYKPVVPDNPSWGAPAEAKTTMPVSQDRVAGRNRPAVSGWGVERPKQFATGGYIGAPQPNSTGVSLHFKGVDTAERKHVVTFEVNGKERQHTLKVVSVDEAVKAVNEIAAMLDLKFVIRKVEVFFE